MIEFWEELWGNEDGQDLMEYALILVLVSLVAVAIVRSIGLTVFNSYSNVSSNLSAAS